MSSDRFARWPKGAARAALAAFLVLLVMSAMVPIRADVQKVAPKGITSLVSESNVEKAEPERPRDEDLAVYDRAIERIGKGESYYDFIVEEQRKAGFPIRPGLAVRLPTLAYLDAALGPTGQAFVALVLMIGVMAAWWRRLRNEPGVTARLQRMALALLFVGASVGMTRYFFVLHELWSGMLLALSFGLHRPEPGGGKWLGAWLAAALALTIRELALPFVLLMAAYACYRRAWREATAWTVLFVLFAAFLAWHLSIIDARTLPSDIKGTGWLAFRGFSGWLSNVALSSNLRFLPHWLAGPAIMLSVLGWTGWKSAAGSFGTLLYCGYGVLFMVAGRPDNYYWGAMVAPAMFMGLAFAPRALKGLWQAAAISLPNAELAGKSPA